MAINKLKYLTFILSKLFIILISLHLTTLTYLEILTIIQGYYQGFKASLTESILSHLEASRSDLKNDDSDRVSLDEIIQQAAREHGISPVLISAMVAIESGGVPTAMRHEGHLVRGTGEAARMQATSIGLMQIIPRFWAGKEPCIESGVVSFVDLFDPRKNVNCGTAIVAKLIKSHNGNIIQALRAYNEGRHGTNGPSTYTEKVMAEVGRIALSQ